MLIISMTGLFRIKDSLANKISYYHLLLLMASLPFNMFYSHLVLISFTIHTIIQLKRDYIKPVFTWRNIALASVFLLTIVSTIYSLNKPEAFVEWGRQAIMLLFPVLFCLTSLDIKKYRPRLLLGFSLVCTLSVAYLFYDALHIIRYYGLPLPAIVSTAFTNHNFSAPIDIHATFFSMQLLISLVYLVTVLIRQQNNYAKLFYSACICLLAAGIFQLSSKSVLFCLFCLINGAIPFFLLKDGKRLRFIVVTSTLSVLTIAGVFCVKAFRERLFTALTTDLSKRRADETTDPRIARWDAAFQLIKKSPVIGHGSGTEIGLLHEVYFEKKYYNSFLNRLNTHNQYLSFLLKSGIIGFVIYLATLAFGFKNAMASRDLLFFSFMAVITFVSFSENYLDVEKGVIFYAIFFTFFSFSNDETPTVPQKIENKAEPIEDEYLAELATN